MILLWSGECLVTSEEFTITLGCQQMYAAAQWATTICNYVEFLAQLKSMHRNNNTEQSLYLESTATNVKLNICKN